MDGVNDSDAALVGLAVAGDRAAFAALARRHYDMLFRVAWQFTGDRGEAEDVTQDVCVRLVKAIASWSREGRFETWAYRVVVNAVRDRQRSHAAERRKREAWAREPHVPASDPDGDEAVAQLWEAVRRLPPKQNEAVTLVHGQGASHAEAAAAMGCAETTVSYHIHEARKRLRVLMSETEESDA